MKIKLKYIPPLLMLAAEFCQAQTNVQSNQSNEDTRPASSNIPEQQYPMIDSKLRTTVQLKDFDAQKVQL